MTSEGRNADGYHIVFDWPSQWGEQDTVIALRALSDYTEQIRELLHNPICREMIAKGSAILID